MEKRAIIAIVLTFFVIVAWSFLQSKFFPPTPVKEAKEVKKEIVAPSEKPAEKATSIKETAKPPQGKPVAVGKMIPKKEVSIETQNYWAVFTNDGARLEHFKLKNFKDAVRETALTTKLIEFVDNLLGRKIEPPKRPEPLDLVNTTQEEGLPLGLRVAESTLALPDGNWEVDKEQLRLLNTGESGEVVFSKSLENGLKILKRFKFSSDRYAMDLELEVQNNTSQEVTGQVGLEWIGKIELAKLADQGIREYGLKYALLKNQKKETKDIGGTGSSGCTPGCESRKRTVEHFESSYHGDIRWFAFEGEYFAALLVSPPANRDMALSVRGGERNLLRADLVVPSFSVASQTSLKIPFQIYLGPKETDRLGKLGVEAQKLVDFGYFSFVAQPLLWFLNLTHRVTDNFGIDIIILSILIKIVFLPLTQISMKSMKEMQKVQPEMNRLKELYKDDKARLQQETMLLYKRRRINPMSGCLPMLVQIPVFIALYNALQNAIEMRHAPFFLWIQDLSAKDPIYITPLIMGATMVIQQKMTPSSADPTQAKMFMLMPIMFTFLFLNFPAGLVLYWLVNNVLSIAHQYYMNKKM